MKHRKTFKHGTVLLYGLMGDTIAYRFNAGKFSILVKDVKRKRKLQRR